MCLRCLLRGRQTARLSVALYDALAPELGIPPEWREVLEDAALIHDVERDVIVLAEHEGRTISDSARLAPAVSVPDLAAMHAQLDSAAAPPAMPGN